MSWASNCNLYASARASKARFADLYFKRGNFKEAEKWYRRAGETKNAQKAQLFALATEYENSEKIQFAIWIWRHLGEFERANEIQDNLKLLMQHSELHYIRDLPDGTKGRTRLYQIDSTPYKVVVKGQDSYHENPMMEVFAYRFDNLLQLNLVPTTILRKVDEESGSVQIYTPGLRGDDYVIQKYKLTRAEFYERAHLDNIGHDDFIELRTVLESLGKRTHFLGFVLGTYDRHPLNFVIDLQLEAIVPEDLYLGRALFDNAGARPEDSFHPDETKILVAGTRRNGIIRTLPQIIPSQIVLDRLSRVTYADLRSIGGTIVTDGVLQGVWNRIRYFQVRR